MSQDISSKLAAKDIQGRGLSKNDFTDSLRSRLIKRQIAIGVVGQSNERGNALLTDESAYPQAFRSLRNPWNCSVPIGPSVSILGGFHCKLYDDLYDWGYDAQIVNAAIGSASFITDTAGFIRFHSVNQSYNKKRSPSNLGDRGYQGDLMSPDGNSIWRCVAGNDIFAVNNGVNLSGSIGGYGEVSTDYITTLPGTLTPPTILKTGPTKPTFTPISKGARITETAGVVWECEGFITAPYLNAGNVCTPTQKGVGFDPLGILQRCHEEMQRIRNVERKIIYIANGQSDAGTTAAFYQAALTSIANFFLARNYEVMIGLTNYSVSVSNAAVNYPILQTGKNAAVTALKAGSYGAKVHSGADLYSLMGTTGPMGAAGSGFMQSDGVHLNAAGFVGNPISGVHCAGEHIANAFKAILTQVT